ncbi:SIR2 family NAD-dependent protein deacylase [Haliovirga abyssi]|uniref:protein acetyllysine N-acetyltransferase n=1 Tax=Haliovirga abyssi TaxID=2996794 RepID=A0AAU9DF59_9FUSO|nr:Sir2 family NAD-dependent protein deacetylase [Haliovirga abyssi]BDU50828.1 NAD-dependent deacylase [Haliovirga abyssi]
MFVHKKIREVARILKNSKKTMVFSGCKIVENEIKKSKNQKVKNLFKKNVNRTIDIDIFNRDPVFAWNEILENFYNPIKDWKPNIIHKTLYEFEKANIISGIVTQNIDGLQIEAGSKNVYEFQGSAQRAVCLECGREYHIKDLPKDFKCPRCNRYLKPKLIFFGEPIPHKTYSKGMKLSSSAEVIILIGAEGNIMPTSAIPIVAKNNGAFVIEINDKPSRYTNSISDIFVEYDMEYVMEKLHEEMNK